MFFDITSFYEYKDTLFAKEKQIIQIGCTFVLGPLDVYIYALRAFLSANSRHNSPFKL